MIRQTPGRWIWLAGMAAWSAFSAAAAFAGGPQRPRLNLLTIIVEDWSAFTPGCYGNPICKTPHLDRFAATAVRFDQAYVQAVCCNPSRTSFLTGLRPLTTGVWSNAQQMDACLPSGARTLPELLKQAGYATAVVGKFFHRVDYAEKQLLAFDRIEMYDKPPGWTGPGPVLSFPPVPRTGVEAIPAPKNRNSREYRQWRRRRSDRYGDSGRTPEQEPDWRKAKTAVALLKQLAGGDQPFFLSVSQSRPHTPLIAPKRYIDMYDPDSLPDPPAPPAALKGCPYPGRVSGGNPDIFTQHQPTPRQAREAIAAYYACVSFVDDNIGMILDAVDQYGLADNTIVVIMGDHGFHLGDHGFWSKYSMYEATRRTPLLVRVPGAAGNGRACRELVEFVDLVPTLCQLLDLPAPDNLEGISFAPLLENPSRPWKQAVFVTQSPKQRGVRTARYSYLRFDDGPVPAALYDLKQDPWETINLASDPAYAEIRGRMASLLDAGWPAALPPERR